MAQIRINRHSKIEIPWFLLMNFSRIHPRLRTRGEGELEGACSYNFNYYALTSVVKHLNEEGHFNMNRTGIKSYSLVLPCLFADPYAGTLLMAASYCLYVPF